MEVERHNVAWSGLDDHSREVVIGRVLIGATALHHDVSKAQNGVFRCRRSGGRSTSLTESFRVAPLLLHPSSASSPGLLLPDEIRTSRCPLAV